MPLVRIGLRNGKNAAYRDDIGRAVDEALYKAIVDRLAAKPNIRPQDVFINLIEVKKENWSFGNGVAQYAS